MDVSPWMNAQGGPSEARRAKEGASADCAEEIKDTTGVIPWRLHSLVVLRRNYNGIFHGDSVAILQDGRRHHPSHACREKRKLLIAGYL